MKAASIIHAAATAGVRAPPVRRRQTAPPLAVPVPGVALHVTAAIVKAVPNVSANRPTSIIAAAVAMSVISNMRHRTCANPEAARLRNAIVLIISILTLANQIPSHTAVHMGTDVLRHYMAQHRAF